MKDSGEKKAKHLAHLDLGGATSEDEVFSEVMWAAAEEEKKGILGGCLLEEKKTKGSFENL